MAKTKLDPETRARWAEEEREFHAYVEARLERQRVRLEREARRRARLRRLSFGLLGRV
ncbi:MAG: hypothetical protein ACRDNG_08190 [Gaiellaceae bacterium]